MRVTATQLPDGVGELEEAWAKLVTHCRDSGPDLVVLPELIFAPWLFVDRPDQAAWEQAASGHRRWLERLGELAAGAVVGSRPVV